MTFLLKYYVTLPLLLAASVGKKCKCICENDPGSSRNKTGGSSENKMQGFIVGGNFTPISLFPHSVAVFLYPVESFYCGGSVLNQNIILTAAHCAPVRLFRKHSIYIMAGHENLLKMDTGRKVKQHVCHADYDVDTVQNDICLLFLSEDLQLGPLIQRVIISPQFTIDVQTADVSGWGTVNDTTKEKSLVLKYTSQTIIPLEKCRTDYKEDWYPGMMCAGDPESVLNRPSKGDSGGALVALGYLQIGLVSFRNPEKLGLVFYTNVSYFYDWIAIQAMTNACGNYNYSGPLIANASAGISINTNAKKSGLFVV